MKTLGKWKSRVSHIILKKAWGRQNIESKKLHFFAAKSSMEFVVNLSKKKGVMVSGYWNQVASNSNLILNWVQHELSTTVHIYYYCKKKFRNIQSSRAKFWYFVSKLRVGPAKSFYLYFLYIKSSSCLISNYM